VIRDWHFGDRPDAYRGYAGDIHNSARFLLELINDLLDMSRLDSQAYTLDESRVLVEDLIRESTRMVAFRAKAERIRIDFDLPAVRTALKVEDRGLRQVMVNLLGNAVKFTPGGGRITVSSGIEPSGEYAVRVTDTGPGIAAKDLDRVMLPFEQVRSPLSGEHGGTGLGLAISRAIIRLHGGDLRLSSTLGEGTTALFTLPAVRIIGSAGDDETVEAHRGPS